MVSLPFGLMRGFVGFGERSARGEDDVWHNTDVCCFVWDRTQIPR
jgi:hypothetical protein